MNNKVDIIISVDKTPVEVGKTNITLSQLPNWEELSSIQQDFITKLARNPLKPKTIAVEFGISKGTLNQWLSNNVFSDMVEMINDIYLESYKEIDAIDAVENSKIRNRVIQSLERGGKYTQEPKEVNENHLHITMADFLKLQDKKGS